jgi:hypothetical protein
MIGCAGAWDLALPIYDKAKLAAGEASATHDMLPR